MSSRTYSSATQSSRNKNYIDYYKMRKFENSTSTGSFIEYKLYNTIVYGTFFEMHPHVFFCSEYLIVNVSTKNFFFSQRVTCLL
jgi:guanylate kinase